MAVTMISDLGELTVPEWVVDIESFRRWTDEPDFPEEGRIWWLCGKVWADMSREQIFTHIGVKTEITSVTHGIAKAGRLGIVLSDGVLLSNFAADISGNPDMTFLTFDTLRSDRIRLIEGSDGGYTELQGSPDILLEVLSKSSVHKDDVVLRQAYWEAGVREYWLVDARKEPLRFDILAHTPRGYVARRKKDGWVKSDEFGKSFHLKQAKSALGHPEYSLEVR